MCVYAEYHTACSEMRVCLTGLYACFGVWDLDISSLAQMAVQAQTG